MPIGVYFRTEETRRNISEAAKYRSRSEETKKKMSLALKKRWQDPNLKIRMSAALKKRWQDPNYKTKMKLKFNTLEYKEKQTASRKRIDIICPICGKTFNGYFSRKYCSIKCEMKNIKIARNRVRVRKTYGLTLEEYIEKTRRCSVCKFDKIVELHHINSRSDNTNVVGLCPNHHRMIHILHMTYDDILKYHNNSKSD